jgi:hypothetical protein
LPLLSPIECHNGLSEVVSLRQPWKSVNVNHGWNKRFGFRH